MNWRLFLGIVAVAFGIAGLVVFGAMVLADETKDDKDSA